MALSTVVPNGFPCQIDSKARGFSQDVLKKLQLEAEKQQLMKVTIDTGSFWMQFYTSSQS
jgi:hypothetical protein